MENAHAIIASMATGRLAATIAEETAGGNAAVPPAPEAGPRIAWGVHMPLDDNSSDDEEDMQTQRRHAKAASQAVVENGGIPGATAKINGKSPWTSMLVLSEAIEVLHEIVSTPSEARPMSARTAKSPPWLDEEAIAAEFGVNLSSAKPPRPSSARSPSKSKPPKLSQSAMKAFDPLGFSAPSKFSLRGHGADADMFRGLAEVPFRPCSPAVLPPVKMPTKMAFVEPASSFPAPVPSFSAMDMDLGAASTSPVRRRSSQSLGSLRNASRSSSQSDIVLPALVKVSKSMSSQTALRRPSIAW